MNIEMTSDFSQLDTHGKYITHMFSTARQFNHAIDDFYVTREGVLINALNKKTQKIYPYIVNKAFACEIYLKLIIKVQNWDVKFKKHDLKRLYEEARIKEEFEKYIGVNTTEYSLDKMYSDFDTISKAFENWRYIYEKKKMTSYYGLLQMLSKYLEDYCKRLIINVYHVNMDDSMM